MTLAASPYLELEERPVVLRNVFPATVTLPISRDDETLRLARVVLTRAAVYVWTEPGEPAYFAELLDPTDPDSIDLAGTFDPPSRPSRVYTADGLVSWVPGEGCGCSHRLKHFRPFVPARLG